MRHTGCVLVAGVQTCALPILPAAGRVGQRLAASLIFVGCHNAIVFFAGDLAVVFEANDDIIRQVVEAHDLSFCSAASGMLVCSIGARRKTPGRRSEEHTSELQSLMRHSYADLCFTNKPTSPSFEQHS